jgi:hypothetical protein
MRDSLLSNTRYDQMVRQILAATGTIVSNPPVAWYKRVKEPNVQLEDVAQLFLGVRMQCAQCHHHPFEKWTQAEYYHLAAFFSQIGRRRGPHFPQARRRPGRAPQNARDAEARRAWRAAARHRAR